MELKSLLLLREATTGKYEWVNVSAIAGLKVKDKLTIVTANGDEFPIDIDLNVFAHKFGFELVPHL